MESVVFHAESSDQDGRVIYYYFDFGDGTTSGWITSSTIEHEYTKAGSYIVSVICQDDDHAYSDWVNISIEIINRAPEVNYSMDISGNTVEVTLNLSDPDGDVICVNITWGDGLWSEGINQTLFSHVYSADGTYTVRVMVSDGHGSYVILTFPVYIESNGDSTINEENDSNNTQSGSDENEDGTQNGSEGTNIENLDEENEDSTINGSDDEKDININGSENESNSTQNRSESGDSGKTEGNFIPGGYNIIVILSLAIVAVFMRKKKNM